MYQIDYKNMKNSSFILSKVLRTFLECDGKPFIVKGLSSNCQSLHSCNDRTSSCKTQVSGVEATFTRNDLQNSCNTQYGGWSGTLPLSLCEREQLLTSLRVIRDAGEGVVGGQDVKLLSVLRTKITSVTSLPSCPPNFCSSDNDPLPCPPPREGACVGLSGTLSYIDRTSLCKPQVSGAEATLPIVAPLSNSLPKGARGIDLLIPSLEGRGSEGVGDTYPSSGTKCHLLPQRGEGISNYNQIIYNNQPSPQPSPTGEEVSNYKMARLH